MAALEAGEPFLARLAQPRTVRRRGRPAVLIGWVIDQHGRRLFAEIVTHSTFVQPSEIEDDTHE